MDKPKSTKSISRPKYRGEEVKRRETMMLLHGNKGRKARHEKYLQREVPNCDPFDAKGTTLFGHCDLKERICDDWFPCCGLVTLYARMGLHRYNLLQGTNYQLSCVKKYNYRVIFAPSTYYITLVAKDPATSLLQTFQTKVDERRLGRFVLTCYIARPQGETKTNKGSPVFYNDSLPEWPTENPFENRKRFYVLKDSELQENDWIRLYVELAIATTNRNTKDHDLSNLKIVKVAIDNTQGPKEGLNAKNATVYISYKDSCEARVGKDVDRIAIVRRTFNKRTGCFSLVGQHQSSEIIPKQGYESECQGLV